MKRGPAPRELVEHRLMDRRADLLGAGVVDGRNGRVGAHAAGVGPLVAVEDPLVVLGGGQRHRAFAVAQRQQRQLVAREELLDDHLLGAEPALDEEVVQRRPRLLLGAR